MGIITKARESVARLLIGDRTWLRLSAADLSSVEQHRYTDLSDDVLGLATRRWFAAIDAAQAKDDEKAGRPVSVFTSGHAMLAIAAYADQVNATDLTINMHLTTDGGANYRNMRLTLDPLPEDFDFGDAGVQKTMDGDKLTSLTMTFDWGGK